MTEVVEGTFPLVPEGTPGAAMFLDSVSFEIQATADARRLSWVSMPICTTDRFMDVDGLKLPVLVGESVTTGTAGVRRRDRDQHRGLRRHRAALPGPDRRVVGRGGHG